MWIINMMFIHSERVRAPQRRQQISMYMQHATLIIQPLYNRRHSFDFLSIQNLYSKNTCHFHSNIFIKKTCPDIYIEVVNILIRFIIMSNVINGENNNKNWFNDKKHISPDAILLFYVMQAMSN